MQKALYYITITTLIIWISVSIYGFFDQRFYHSAVIKLLFIITAALMGIYLVCIICKKWKKYKRHEQIDKLLDKN